MEVFARPAPVFMFDFLRGSLSLSAHRSAICCEGSRLPDEPACSPSVVEAASFGIKITKGYGSISQQSALQGLIKNLTSQAIGQSKRLAYRQTLSDCLTSIVP